MKVEYRSFPVLCDIDGVVWLAHAALPGAAEAVNLLRNSGHRVVFVTNNSYATVDEQEKYLERVGIPASGDVVTSAMATGFLIRPEMRVYVCGGPGLVEALERNGAVVLSEAEIDEDPTIVDVVAVGFHRTFNYDVLKRASMAISAGAQFLASNEDATYPTPQGPIPGGGSIVAAIAVASGTSPIVAGKPHSVMAELIRSKVDGIDSESIMIGDRPSTDGLFAKTLGTRFALVHSDVSEPELMAGDSSVSNVRIDFHGASLLEVAEQILAEG